MLSCSWERSYKCCIVEQGTCKGPGEAHSCRRSAHKSTARYRAPLTANQGGKHIRHLLVSRIHQVDATGMAISQSTADHIVCLTCRQACRDKIIARQQTRSCPLQSYSVEPSVESYLFISIKALRDLASRSTSFTVPHASNSCLQGRRP